MTWLCACDSDMQTSCLQGVLSASSVQGNFVLLMVLPSSLWQRFWLLVSMAVRIWTIQPFDNRDSPAITLPVRRLTFLCGKGRSTMSKDEWRNLIAGIPEDVEKCIGMLKSKGTQLYWHICLIVHYVLLRRHVLYTANFKWPKDATTVWTCGLQQPIACCYIPVLRGTY